MNTGSQNGGRRGTTERGLDPRANQLSFDNDWVDPTPQSDDVVVVVDPVFPAVSNKRTLRGLGDKQHWSNNEGIPTITTKGSEPYERDPGNPMDAAVDRVNERALRAQAEARAKEENDIVLAVEVELKRLYADRGVDVETLKSRTTNDEDDAPAVADEDILEVIPVKKPLSGVAVAAPADVRDTETHTTGTYVSQYAPTGVRTPSDSPIAVTLATGTDIVGDAVPAVLGQPPRQVDFATTPSSARIHAGEVVSSGTFRKNVKFLSEEESALLRKRDIVVKYCAEACVAFEELADNFEKAMDIEHQIQPDGGFLSSMERLFAPNAATSYQLLLQEEDLALAKLAKRLDTYMMSLPHAGLLKALQSEKTDISVQSEKTDISVLVSLDVNDESAVKAFIESMWAQTLAEAQMPELRKIAMARYQVKCREVREKYATKMKALYDSSTSVDKVYLATKLKFGRHADTIKNLPSNVVPDDESVSSRPLSVPPVSVPAAENGAQNVAAEEMATESGKLQAVLDYCRATLRNNETDRVEADFYVQDLGKDATMEDQKRVELKRCADRYQNILKDLKLRALLIVFERCEKADLPRIKNLEMSLISNFIEDAMSNPSSYWYQQMVPVLEALRAEEKLKFEKSCAYIHEKYETPQSTSNVEHVATEIPVEVNKPAVERNRARGIKALAALVAAAALGVVNDSGVGKGSKELNTTNEPIATNVVPVDTPVYERRESDAKAPAELKAVKAPIVGVPIIAISKKAEHVAKQPAVKTTPIINVGKAKQAPATQAEEKPAEEVAGPRLLTQADKDIALKKAMHNLDSYKQRVAGLHKDDYKALTAEMKDLLLRRVDIINGILHTMRDDTDLEALNDVYKRMDEALTMLEKTRTAEIAPKYIANADLDVKIAIGRITNLKILLGAKTTKVTVKYKYHEVMDRHGRDSVAMYRPYTLDLAKMRADLDAIQKRVGPTGIYTPGSLHITEEQAKQDAVQAKYIADQLNWALWYARNGEMTMMEYGKPVLRARNVKTSFSQTRK